MSLLTRPRDEKELTGLVYSLTSRPHDDATAWYLSPAALGGAVLAGTVLLNVAFW